MKTTAHRKRVKPRRLRRRAVGVSRVRAAAIARARVARAMIECEVSDAAPSFFRTGYGGRPLPE